MVKNKDSYRLLRYRFDQYYIAETTFVTDWRKEKRTVHDIECKQEYIELCSGNKG